MKSSITSTPGGTVFSGPDAVAIFRATAIASALKLYANTGMKMNRAYTPTAMMKAAHQITGLKFKPRQYLEAAAALKEWALMQSALLNAKVAS